MSGLSLAQRFWFAVDDVGRALRFVFRPWTELRAVKTTQVDIVNAVSACQADIADARAALDKCGEALARLEAGAAEQAAITRELRERMQERGGGEVTK